MFFRSEYQQDERGATLVEAALVMGFLSICFVAFIDLYAVLSLRGEATEIAQRAGREAMIRITEGGTCEEARQQIEQRFTESLGNLSVNTALRIETTQIIDRNINLLFLDLEVELPCILCKSALQDLSYQTALTFVIEEADSVLSCT